MINKIKLSAYSGIFLIVITLVFGILFQLFKILNLNSLLILIPLINTYITIILGIIFYSGFIILGKKYKSRLLKVTSYLAVIFLVILILILFIGNILSIITSVSAQTTSTRQLTDQDYFNSLKSFYLSFFLPVAIALGIFSIFFGIGLINIKKNVKFAKASGIINIISGLTYFIFIGFIFNYISIIIEIILLFNESSKI